MKVNAEQGNHRLPYKISKYFCPNEQKGYATFRENIHHDQTLRRSTTLENYKERVLTVGAIKGYAYLSQIDCHKLIARIFAVVDQILILTFFKFSQDVSRIYQLLKQREILQTSMDSNSCLGARVANARVARGKSKTGCFAFNEPRARVYKSIGQPGWKVRESNPRAHSFFFIFFFLLLFLSSVLSYCVCLVAFAVEKIALPIFQNRAEFRVVPSEQLK